MVDFILHVTASGERTDETLAELARQLDRGLLAPEAHGRVRSLA